MRIKKSYIKYAVPVLAFIILSGVLIYSMNTRNELTYNTFLSYVASGKVEEVSFQENENYVQVTLTDDIRKYKVPNPKSEEFLDYLLAHNVSVMYADGSASSPVLPVLAILGIVGGIFYYRSKTSKSTLIQNVNQDDRAANTPLLSDIAGNEEAKAMVQDIIQFIKTPEKYTRLGAKMPHGILFYGPPGTGKTLMAKAIANEAGVAFYPMRGSDFIQMYVGVGASRIRELFQAARKSEKAVIFIDEIDAIGKKRSGHGDNGSDERDQTLNALLTEMSGFHDREGIVVIAATNRLDTLDEALTRPGRFDRLVEIALPDLNARKKILKLHAGNRNLADTVNLSELAKSTSSFSGAMLENLLNEAAIFAANENCSYIESEHVDKAFFTVIAGAEKSDTSCITQKDRRITAFHEAGHALVTSLLMPDSYIARVTIIPSTRGAGGFSLSIPKDSLYMTKQNMLAHLKVLLAGRASEELIFGRDAITTGASNDIEKASGLILDYINKYGMDDDFGLFNVNVLHTSPSSDLVQLCRNNMKTLYSETLHILQEHQSLLHSISQMLLEKETLTGEDIDRLKRTQTE